MKMHKFRKHEIFAFIILVFMLASSAYVYPQMPEKMVTHWNAAGQADGHMAKAVALFMLPLISGVFFVIMSAVPKIDPLKSNIKKFSRDYEMFLAAFMAFFFYVHIITLLLNMGIAFNITQALAPALGLFFYCCGILISKSRQNWFIGIRTPWTMSSKNVWNKTHRLGGKLFKIAGAVAFTGMLFSDYAMWLTLGPIIMFSACMVVYSYVEYRKENA